MDGIKELRKKHLLAINKTRNTKEREGAADGVNAGPAEGAAVTGPAAGAEDPMTAQPQRKRRGARWRLGLGSHGRS